MPKQLTIEAARLRIQRLTIQVAYWKRRSKKPGYDAQQRARQRSRNPVAYQRNLCRYRRAVRRKKSLRLLGLIVFATAFQIALAKRSKRATQATSN